jgi:hypothetical protein
MLIAEIYRPRQDDIWLGCVILVVNIPVDTACMVHATERKIFLEKKRKCTSITA